MAKSTPSKKAKAEPAKAGFSQFTPKAILSLFLERWWIGLIVGAICATAYILAQPKLEPVYTSRAALRFETKKANIINMQEVVNTSANSNLDIRLHIRAMETSTFRQSVMASFSAKELEQIQNAYRDPLDPQSQPPTPANIIFSNLDIRESETPTIVNITVTNKDPECAAMIANRIARKYIDYTIDDATSNTSSAIVFLKNQAEEKRSEVEAAERAMQAFRSKNNMAAIGENKSVVLQKVASLGAAMVEAELSQSTLRTQIETIEEFKKTKQDLFLLNTISSAAGVRPARAEIEALHNQRTLMAQNWGNAHPRMKDNDLAIKNAQSRLDEAIALAIAELNTRYKVALQHEQRLRRDMIEAEEKAREFDKTTIEYKFLEEDAATKRSAYTTINTRLNETSVVSQLENTTIKIMERAGVASSPSNNSPKQIAVQSAAIGLALLILVPIGLGFLDTRVKSNHDVEVGLEQVLLGGIKTMRSIEEKDRPTVFLGALDDALSEAYRGVFSEIEIRSTFPFPKRILVTSSVPGEGKSLTASNLAAVFASHGKKTLLVDCDFRRPTLRRYFSAKPNIGLLPWLIKNGHDANAVPTTEDLGITNIAPLFDLLLAGDSIKNPTEIIDQIAHTDFFNKMGASYDVILIDTPPSAVFPDALLLSRFCVELIYVCRFKTVRKAVIKKTLSKFTEAGITPLGVILNAVPNSSALNYGYDGYGSYNSKYYKAYQGEKSSAPAAAVAATAAAKK